MVPRRSTSHVTWVARADSHNPPLAPSQATTTNSVRGRRPRQPNSSPNRTAGLTLLQVTKSGRVWLLACEMEVVYQKDLTKKWRSTAHNKRKMRGSIWFLEKVQVEKREAGEEVHQEKNEEDEEIVSYHRHWKNCYAGRYGCFEDTSKAIWFSACDD